MTWSRLGTCLRWTSGIAETRSVRGLAFKEDALIFADVVLVVRTVASASGGSATAVPAVPGKLLPRFRWRCSSVFLLPVLLRLPFCFYLSVASAKRRRQEHLLMFLLLLQWQVLLLHSGTADEEEEQEGHYVHYRYLLLLLLRRRQGRRRQPYRS